MPGGVQHPKVGYQRVQCQRGVNCGGGRLRREDDSWKTMYYCMNSSTVVLKYLLKRTKLVFESVCVLIFKNTMYLIITVQYVVFEY